MWLAFEYQRETALKLQKLHCSSLRDNDAISSKKIDFSWFLSFTRKCWQSRVFSSFLSPQKENDVFEKKIDTAWKELIMEPEKVGWQTYFIT